MGRACPDGLTCVSDRCQQRCTAGTECPSDATCASVGSAMICVATGSAMDASLAEAGVDAAMPAADSGQGSDVGADAASTDTASSDAGLVDAYFDPIGCADGTRENTYAVDMIGCGGNVAQCSAETLCAPGWHLCTYDEYSTRLSAPVPAMMGQWLSSCIRDGGPSLSCPTTHVCTCATGPAGLMLDAVLSCDGTSVIQHANMPYVGLIAQMTPSMGRPGCAAAPCAPVTAVAPTTSHGAVCCH